MKKLTLICGLLVSAMVMMTSCGGGSNQKGLSPDYIPFKMDKEGNWGLMDKNFKPLFSDEFEGKISPAYDGVFSVQTGDRYALYKAEEKPSVIAGCDDLLYAGIMSEGVIPIVKENSRITYVDKSGKEKFTLMPHNGKEIIEVEPFFTNGKAVIKTEDNKQGAINSSGKVIVEPKYDAVEIRDGFILAMNYEETEENKKQTNTILLDNSGKEVKTFKDRKISDNTVSFIDGTFVLYSKNGEGEKTLYLIDKVGKELKKYSTKKSEPRLIYNDYYTYSDDGKMGIKSRDKDEIIIRAKYDFLVPVEDDLFVVARNDKASLINLKDEVVKSLGDEYELVLPLNFNIPGFFQGFPNWNYLIAEVDNNLVTFLDFKGEKISNNEYIVNLDQKYRIYSDYFNAAEVGQKLSDLIVKEYIPKFGKNITEYTTSNANGYQNYQGIGIEVKPFYKTSMSCYLFSNEQVAVMNNSWMYEYNPNALVNGFKLTLTLSYKENAEKLVAEVAKSLYESLSKNGYTLQESEAAQTYALQHKESMNSINISYNNNTIEIVGSMTEIVGE